MRPKGLGLCAAGGGMGVSIFASDGSMAFKTGSNCGSAPKAAGEKAASVTVSAQINATGRFLLALSTLCILVMLLALLAANSLFGVPVSITAMNQSIKLSIFQTFNHLIGNQIFGIFTTNG